MQPLPPPPQASTLSSGGRVAGRKEKRPQSPIPRTVAVDTPGAGGDDDDSDGERPGLAAGRGVDYYFIYVTSLHNINQIIQALVTIRIHWAQKGQSS